MKKEISSQVNYYNNKNKKQQITINKYILDEISVRFLVQIDESDFQNVERLFFILEEAHWFYIDNYREKNICFIDFCNLIVNHNSLQIDVNKGFKIFRNYKKGIKVFGCIIFDRSMENVLVVQEKRVGSYSFPKEEIGYDVSQKIIKHVTFTIFEKMNFFLF
ncbi:mrna decapping enzyme 2 [Vairimorpha apis BRL 01]|uniref:Mrna decapping enzyme 2 n=1 Tax=Vairimorpha apis BRL 01 TaxID=1037528 RepID=T0M8R4_9MICR|nr:mrna decapping enzyme 2 [Vairimorpha apis BRL 01]